MRYLAVLFFCIASIGAVAAETSVAGKWQVKTNIAGSEGASVCTFAQKDLALSGACTGDDGDHPLTGKIEGDKVTWEYKTEFNGAPLTIVFTGSLKDGKKLEGTVEVQPMGVTGDFSATQK